MNRSALCAVTLFALGFSAHDAFALPLFDDFNGITTTALSTAPTGWQQINGSVDSINNSNSFGPGGTNIRCLGNTGGCVDLDGTTGKSAILETVGTFNLVKGHTYELSARVSGNQRTATPNDLQFGFLTGTTSIFDSKTVSGIGEHSPYTLYTLFYTATATVAARVFFYDVGGTNNQGPMLDNVRLHAVSLPVPLPAAAWLMLSGLAALGAVARRRISGTGAA